MATRRQQRPCAEACVFAALILHPAQGLGEALSLRRTQGHFATADIHNGSRVLGGERGGFEQGFCVGTKFFQPKFTTSGSASFRGDAPSAAIKMKILRFTDMCQGA
jgi:hypothetical protein